MIVLKRIGALWIFLDSGSQKCDYMAWRLLRLVFKDCQNSYYLIAIINDEWTV